MKIIYNTFFAVLLFAAKASFCQAPIVSWQRPSGGGFADIGYDLQKTSDDGFITVGYTSSDDGDVPGNHGTANDYYIIKFDSARNIQWTKNLGGTGRDEAFSIRQTTDGGYIVAGLSESNDGDVTGHHDPVYQRDCWIVKLDASGAITWQKSLGGTYTDIAHCIQQTTDGGYIIAGETFSFDGDVSGGIANGDYWIVKLDPSGNITWEKTYGGSAYEVANYIQQSKDGGYIIAGASNSIDYDITTHHGTNLTSDYWIVKINPLGKIQWQRSLGGTANDIATTVRQTKDGGYLVGGSAASTDGEVTGQHGSTDVWLVKLSAAGNIKWQHAYGGAANDDANDIERLNDGGFIITASSGSTDGDAQAYHGQTDYWIFKINNSGVIQWSNTYGGAQNDVAYATRAMQDGTYYTTGYTSSYDADASGNHGSYDILLLNLGTVPLSHTISVTEVTPQKICWEQPAAVNYDVTGVFNPGNIFTAQISDNNGSFVNATSMGSVTSITSGSISFVIPSALKPSPSGGYYIRVISSDPELIGGAFPYGLKMKCNDPEGLKSTNVTSSSATLSWKIPSCPIEYVVKWKPTNSNDWDSTEVITNTLTITGLIPNIQYDWRVKELCSTDPQIFSEWSKKKEFTTAPLKLDESILSDAIKVFPNPASDMIKIISPDFHGDQILITDMLGHVRLHQSFSSEMDVDISLWSDGIYMVQLKSGSTIITKQFIKE